MGWQMPGGEEPDPRKEEQSSLLFRHRPSRVRVAGGHGLGEGGSLGAEVFLIDLASLVDDEGHHPGVAPFGGPGDQREARDHLPVDDVVGPAQI